MSEVPPRNYLKELGSRAARGLESFNESFLSRQSRCILAARQPDGGFAGRSATSDLYYTSFALRCAELLGIDDPELWREAAQYLRECVAPPETVLDCFSILHGTRLIELQLCAGHFPEIRKTRQDTIASLLRRCLTPQGGVAMVQGGAAGIYHTFLAMLCHHLLGRPMPGAKRAMGFVLACMREDGGFADQSDAAAEGGTNPTAAAVALLVMHDALDDAVAEKVADFIAGMQREDGGFAAHAGAPMSDIMSTFTALVTLAELCTLRRLRLAPVARYVQGLAGTEGGFRGTAMDDVIDPEYTYYGLGALGILGTVAAGDEPRAKRMADINR